MHGNSESIAVKCPSGVAFSHCPSGSIFGITYLPPEFGELTRSWRRVLGMTKKMPAGLEESEMDAKRNELRY
jgi:hypothetical protein